MASWSQKKKLTYLFDEPSLYGQLSQLPVHLVNLLLSQLLVAGCTANEAQQSRYTNCYQLGICCMIQMETIYFPTPMDNYICSSPLPPKPLPQNKIFALKQ